MTHTYNVYGKSLENLQFHAINHDSFQTTVLILAKNSPWTEVITNGILRLRQTGQLDQMFKSWLIIEQERTASLTATADPVQIGQVVWAFLGFLSVTLIAFITFVLEKLFRKYPINA